MGKNDLQLLDCTLRDGGYVNSWNWGFERSREVIRALVKADIDVVEVGFLRNVDEYNSNITVCNRIEELNRLLPKNSGNTMFSAMAMRSNYDINKLSPYNGKGIEMIRITAHEYDIKEGMEFAKEVKARGYKLSINPINIMGYSDEQILWIISQVNEIQPYQFSIVDTFGSMKRRDLDRIVGLVDNNLDRSIRVALHLHENMSLGCCLAQRFVDYHLDRPVAIDGSLMGMGRIPGNLPIELIADYLNDYLDKHYEIDYLMDAIQDYIAPLKGETEWGYIPAYFLSARFNLHRNYAEHYLKKGDLTNRDINHILSRFDREKASVFDEKYAEYMYETYKTNQIDDTEDKKQLKNKLEGKNILVLAPGKTICTHEEDIERYISHTHTIIVSVNFIPSQFNVDIAFYSNKKRYDKIDEKICELIVTSNLVGVEKDYYIDYNSVSGSFDQGCNSLIMLLKLFETIGVRDVALAGADGYMIEGDNYYNPNLRSYSEHGKNFNVAVSKAMDRLNLNINFITPTEYRKK